MDSNSSSLFLLSTSPHLPFRPFILLYSSSYPIHLPLFHFPPSFLLFVLHSFFSSFLRSTFHSLHFFSFPVAPLYFSSSFPYSLLLYPPFLYPSVLPIFHPSLCLSFVCYRFSLSPSLSRFFNFLSPLPCFFPFTLHFVHPSYSLSLRLPPSLPPFFLPFCAGFFTSSSCSSFRP